MGGLICYISWLECVRLYDFVASSVNRFLLSFVLFPLLLCSGFVLCLISVVFKIGYFFVFKIGC